MEEVTVKIKYLVLEKLKNELNRDIRFKVSDQSCANDIRLDIIIALIDQMKWPLDKTIDIITAVFLLHISNDIQQDVSEENQADKDWNILQGDRLSSQAYILLVKYQALNLIETMARGLKEINYLKIDLKQFVQSDDFESQLYIKMKTEIDLKLIKYLIDYLELTDYANGLLGESSSTLSSVDLFH